MYKFVSGAKSVKQYRGDENLPEAKNGMKKCGCKHSKSKYKYQSGERDIAADKLEYGDDYETALANNFKGEELELPEGDAPLTYAPPVQKVSKTKPVVTRNTDTLKRKTFPTVGGEKKIFIEKAPVTTSSSTGLNAPRKREMEYTARVRKYVDNLAGDLIPQNKTTYSLDRDSNKMVKHSSNINRMYGRKKLGYTYSDLTPEEQKQVQYEQKLRTANALRREANILNKSSKYRKDSFESDGSFNKNMENKGVNNMVSNIKKYTSSVEGKSKYKYGTGALAIPEGSAIVTAQTDKRTGKKPSLDAIRAYKKGNYKLLNNIIDDMPEDNVDKAKKGIKNTYRKYKFQEGTSSVNVDEDDTWIRKILNFESTKGSSEGKGLSNFGYNDWKKLGHSRPPESIDEAVEYYKKDYLPKVKNYPVEVRKRIGDYIFNTGRSPEDLLLHASGKLSLKELNSTGTSKDKWETNKGEIEKMFSDPNFISKLDKSRDDVYKTTKTTNGQPNSAYNNSWKDRVNLFNDNASSSTNNAPVSQNTQTQQTQGPVNSASSQTPVPSTQNTPQGNSKVTEIKGNFSTDPITKETYQENFVLGGPKKYGKEMSLDKAKNLYGLTNEQFETAYGKNKKSDTYRIEKGRRQAIKDKNVYYNVAGKVDKNGELLKYSSGYKTQPNEGEKPKETPVKLPPPPEEIPPPTTKTPPDDTGKRKEYVTMPSMAEIAARSSILGQGIEGIPENYLKLGRYNYASQLDRTLRENAIAANTAKENIRDVSGGSAGSYLSNVANITGKRFDANAGAVTQDTLARQDILNKNVDLGNTEAQVNTGLKNQYAELRGKARSNYNDQLVALGQRIDSATETAQEMSNQRGADDQRMQVLKDLGLNYEYQNVNGLKKLVPKVPVNTPPTTTGTPDAVSKKGLKKVKTYKRR